MSAHDADANFARRLAKLRDERNMSQSELARRMVSRGFEKYSQMTVSRTEKGERPVPLSEALSLAEIFDETVYEMSRGTDRDQAVEIFTTIEKRLVDSILDVRNSVEYYAQTCDEASEAAHEVGHAYRGTEDPEMVSAIQAMKNLKFSPYAVGIWAAEKTLLEYQDLALKDLTDKDLRRLRELEEEESARPHTFLKFS